jgi:hypothetical protein
MKQGELNKLADLHHLFATATDIIVSNIGQVGFFIFTLDRIAL